MKQADIALKGYRICARLLNIKFAFPQCVISVKSYKFDFIFHEWSFYKSVQRYGVFYINEKINSDKWEVNILSATY